MLAAAGGEEKSDSDDKNKQKQLIKHKLRWIDKLLNETKNNLDKIKD